MTYVYRDLTQGFQIPLTLQLGEVSVMNHVFFSRHIKSTDTLNTCSAKPVAKSISLTGIIFVLFHFASIVRVIFQIIIFDEWQIKMIFQSIECLQSHKQLQN